MSHSSRLPLRKKHCPRTLPTLDQPCGRWVVEQIFAWLKGFLSLRTRYRCYLVNFMGLIYLAFVYTLWRKLA